MDPVTLAEAATALLVAKAGGSMAAEAGKAAWHGLETLYNTVRRRVQGDLDAEQALDELGAGDAAEQRATLVRSIARWAETDLQFYDELLTLVTLAQQQPRLTSLVAQAFDDAKQVNIGGDNAGPIAF